MKRMHSDKRRLAMGTLCLCLAVSGPAVRADAEAAPTGRLDVAAVTTVYRKNSHAELIVGRLLDTHTLDGKGRVSPLRLRTLYTDQVPENDTSRSQAKVHGFALVDKAADAIAEAQGKPRVRGVLLVAEHGDYPRSEAGSLLYPKRRLFEQVLAGFDRAGKVAPVYIDKHIADNWQDIAWIYGAARERDIPLMAGSSVPLVWREPAVDVRRDAKIQQIVAVSYHTLDAYGFHALEVVQSLAERRVGGETGIAQVRCLVGDAVWQAGRDGVYDAKLLDAALNRMTWKRFAERPLEEAVKEPSLFEIHYQDGMKAFVLTLPGVVREWAAAWRYEGGESEATLFRLQEDRPYLHFSLLLTGIERMMVTGKPAWPVERTVYTSGMLDALLQSRLQKGIWIQTPHLAQGYASDWDWAEFMASMPEKNALEVRP